MGDLSFLIILQMGGDLSWDVKRKGEEAIVVEIKVEIEVRETERGAIFFPFKRES
jgi:hypothetical protein